MREHIIQLRINPTERAAKSRAVKKTTWAQTDEGDGGGKKWLRDNAVGIVGLLLVVVGALMGYAKLEAKVDALTKIVETNSERAETNYSKIDAHEKDTSRHVDPVRDKELWDDLKRRLQRIEDKLDGK